MDLPVIHLPDHLVPPHRFLANGHFEMGVYDSDGRVAPSSLLHRSYAPGARRCLSTPQAPSGHPTLSLPRAIYGGMMSDHYGHFLTESLSRLWYAEVDRDSPILLTLPRRFQTPFLLSWQRAVFDLLGLAQRIVPLTQIARVGDLAVPAPGYEIRYTFAARHARFLARVPWQPVPGRKLWLSRALLGGAVNPMLEAIDTLLAQQGWDVIHPETLTLPQQLAALASAQRIAGEEGSALHTLVFLKDCEGLRLDMMVRDPDLFPDRTNANQHTICAAKGIVLHSHAVPGERVLSRKGAHVDKVYAPAGVYVECLGG